MQINFRHVAGAAAIAAAALGFSSCAYAPYDPYYAAGSPRGSSYYPSDSGVSVGYGDGYGYGGDSFSTSVFIGTGDSRWGYDPYSYSYYDYNRHLYYDPYLNGYYPMGYRPPVVYGASHPYGWRPGMRSIRPPSHYSNVTLSNYRHRESSYRNSGYSSGSHQARQQPFTSDRQQPQSSPQSVSGSRYSAPNPYTRPSGGTYSRDRHTAPQGTYTRPSGTTYSRPSSASTYSRPSSASTYSQPVSPQTTRQPATQASPRTSPFAAPQQQRGHTPPATQGTPATGRERQPAEPGSQRDHAHKNRGTEDKNAPAPY